MCGEVKALSMEQVCSYRVKTGVCVITAVVLALLGTLCYKGQFGGGLPASFVGGTLVLLSIPFVLVAGFRAIVGEKKP